MEFRTGCRRRSCPDRGLGRRGRRCCFVAARVCSAWAVVGGYRRRLARRSLGRSCRRSLGRNRRLAGHSRRCCCGCRGSCRCHCRRSCLRRRRGCPAFGCCRRRFRWCSAVGRFGRSICGFAGGLRRRVCCLCACIGQ